VAEPLDEREVCCVCAYKHLNFWQERWLQSVCIVVKRTAPSGCANKVTEPKTWMCLICGWIYDEAAGDPEHDIAPGTRWEAVPMNWTCPECGARKEDFEMVQI
jgi:rubredoxin